MAYFFVGGTTNSMDVTLVVWILVLVVLVLFSAFFSSSETALIGSGRVKLIHLSEQGVRGAGRALRLVEQPGDLLATILVGNNLVNVMAAALATALLGPFYATLVITLVLLIFAEITPKTLATINPERFAARIALPVEIFRVLFLPVVWATTFVTDLLLWPFLGRQSIQKRRLSRQELLTAIRLGARDGELEPAETRMTREVLTLKDTPVSDIMIPMAEVDAIPETASFEDVLREFAKTENTRYPIYRQQKGEMVGLLLVKDFVVQREDMEENWLKHVRPLMRCSVDLDSDELLRDMQLRRSHMAAVEDKEGAVVGVVTMEDVLEEIVGEIQDEYDDDEGDLIVELRPGRYLVRGDLEIDDMCKVMNVDLGTFGDNMTLAEWFEMYSPLSSGAIRRVKIGSIRITHRSGHRYEILVKTQVTEALGEKVD